MRSPYPFCESTFEHLVVLTYLGRGNRTNGQSVSTSPLEERARLAAVVETSLKLAGARDPELLLRGVRLVAREILPAQYASAGLLDEDEQTISGWAFFRGMDAAAVRPETPVLRLDLLVSMLSTHKALRLRDLTSEGLGFELLPEDYHLASVLGVPLSSSPRVQGSVIGMSGWSSPSPAK